MKSPLNQLTDKFKGIELSELARADGAARALATLNQMGPLLRQSISNALEDSKSVIKDISAQYPLVLKSISVQPAAVEGGYPSVTAVLTTDKPYPKEYHRVLSALALVYVRNKMTEISKPNEKYICHATVVQPE